MARLMDTKDKYIKLVERLAYNYGRTVQPGLLWEAMCVRGECLQFDQLYSQAKQHLLWSRSMIERPEWLEFDFDPWKEN